MPQRVGVHSKVEHSIEIGHSSTQYFEYLIEIDHSSTQYFE